mgnify:CR=1 FL=1
MPLIKVTLGEISKSIEDSLLSSLSKEISELTNKPEKYVMVISNSSQNILFGGSREDSCFIEVKSIGSIEPKTMTKRISAVVERHCSIPAERVYIKFEDVKASNWGWNNNTFG